MALLTSELQRIKVELGYNSLTLSALPYAFDGITQIFDQVVQPYLQSGEKNFSSTAVSAASSPTIVTLTLLTTPTAIVVGDRLIVDQDSAQELAHATAVTPNSVTVALQNAHASTYPVTVEGGEAIARGLLRNCVAISDRIMKAASRAGVAKADEVEFFASKPEQLGVFDDLRRQQRYWRCELAEALGVPNLREERAASGQLLESY